MIEPEDKKESDHKLKNFPFWDDWLKTKIRDMHKERLTKGEKKNAVPLDEDKLLSVFWKIEHLI